MTKNQLQYHANQEIIRHNRAVEDETHRSNTVDEGERNRHNIVGEIETHRTNVKNEALKNDANAIAKYGHDMRFMGKVVPTLSSSVNKFFK